MNLLTFLKSFFCKKKSSEQQEKGLSIMERIFIDVLEKYGYCKIQLKLADQHYALFTGISNSNGKKVSGNIAFVVNSKELEIEND